VGGGGGRSASVSPHPSPLPKGEGALNPGNITFDATSGSPGTYVYDGTSVRLTNPSDGSSTDLLLFHLAITPALPNLNIPALSPALGTFIYTMGYGLGRDPNVAYYNMTGTGMSTVFTETTQAMATYAGFKEITANIKRWGTNLTRDNRGNGQALQTFDIGLGNLNDSNHFPGRGGITNGCK
jgi:hypothetical protein